MPRKNRKFQSLLKELERLGLLDEAIAILKHLQAIDRIVQSVKTKTTVPTFIRTVEAENPIG